jgi:hypothetical protein
MPEIIETTVYRLDELSDEAKDKARAWYRQVGLDHDWFEFVYDDFERICAILGVDLKTVPVRLYGGATRHLVLGLLEPGRRRLLRGALQPRDRSTAGDPRSCAEGQ